MPVNVDLLLAIGLPADFIADQDLRLHFLNVRTPSESHKTRRVFLFSFYAVQFTCSKTMFFFAVSIFLSAFLLFQIQPMIGKFILPWFGGTPAVWATVLLFFQVLLTGGYAYAYWLMGRVRPQRQRIVHVALITSAIALLVFLSFIWISPITPDSSWKPA